MKSWFKEPFVQFVILGVVLFLSHSLWALTQSDADRLVVETAEMERQALIFAGENRRQPTDDDLQALLYAYIEEEVLVREAIKRGLDTGDTIIRRRLAQKMRFLVEDVTTFPDPSAIELETWFESKSSDYAVPETISFTHIYLSPEQHGAALTAHAESLLAQIQENPEIVPATLGDPFMLQKSFHTVTRSDINGVFGPKFSEALFAKSNPTENPLGWKGLIGSPFGLHILRVDARTSERPVDFETVRDQVLLDWRDLKTREANQEAVKDLIKRYTIEVEGAD